MHTSSMITSMHTYSDEYACQQRHMCIYTHLYIHLHTYKGKYFAFQFWIPHAHIIIFVLHARMSYTKIVKDKNPTCAQHVDHACYTDEYLHKLMYIVQVFIVDSSGSMKADDVTGYRTRTEAVYKCLLG
jgi:hypothetical protein